MKYSKLFSVAVLGLGIGFSGCSRDKNEKPNSSTATAVERHHWSPKSEIASAQIRVLNQFGEGISGAQILVGQAPGNPFRDNFVTTDSLGRATISNAWKSAASVTIDANGYIRQTLLNQTPGNIVLKLNPLPLSQQAEMRGNVTQLPVVNGDKLIDFALVMPAVTRADLLSFDIGQVISPYTDTLSAAGQKSDIPSNVSIPKQKESYIIGITLDKPLYRLKMSQLGNRKVVAARGRFVFKDVVSELRKGKSFHDLINHFSIEGGSMRDVTIVSGVTNLEIAGNDIQFNQQIPVKTASALADEIQIVLAASDFAGFMMPTDVKRATHGEPLNLQSIAGKQTMIVNVIKKQSEFMSDAPGASRMSASMTPYSATVSPRLLPLMANPTISGSSQYTIRLPNLPHTTGINPTATSASIADLVEVTDGNKKITLAIKRWEVIGAGWNQSITLPDWSLPQTNNRKRVEVNFIGSTISKSTDIDDRLINNATHVTHASADF